MIKIVTKEIPHSFRNKYLRNTGGSISTGIQGSGAGAVDISSKLDKTIWDAVFYTDENGNLRIKTNLIGEMEISAYGGDGTGDNPNGSITIVDNLLSNATDCALSANQGRVLKALIDGKVSSVNWNDIAGKPSTLTDANISLWIDAASKRHEHGNKAILDGITSVLVGNWNVAFTHVSDAIKHITATERNNWNAAFANNHTHGNKSVLDGITSTLVGNWNTAYTNNHTHANKIVLDGITSDRVSNWDGVVTNWNKAFYFDANGNLKVKVSLIGEQEVSAYGEGSTGGGSGVVTIVDALTSASTDAALSANQGRVLKALIDGKVSSVNWNDIAGKPSSFTPSAHGHAISEIASLQGVLDGKAANGHTHSYLPLGGGTLTGNVTISTDSFITWSRNTDYAKIWFKNTGDGDSDSYLGFETGDNGNEYFRWAGNAGGTVTEWMSLKSDGLRIKGTLVSLSNHNHNGDYVQSLGTNGNYLTWTKNGAVNNITVPYATIASKLQTARTIWGQSFDGTNNIVGNLILGTNALVGYNGLPMLKVYGTSGNTSFNGNGNEAWIGHTNTKTIYFGTSPDSPVSNPIRMTITADGKVGIATSVPAQKLHVEGHILAAGGQFISTITTGNAPVNVASTTVCPNLNADMLDGYHQTAFNMGWTSSTKYRIDRWGGGQDKDWKKIVTYVDNNGGQYSACKVKGVFYLITGNHSQAQVVDIPFEAIMYAYAGTANSILNQSILYLPSYCAWDLIRIVRYANNSWEVQVRQPNDWNNISLEYTVAGSSKAIAGQFSNTTNSTVVANNYNTAVSRPNTDTAYIAEKLQTARTLWSQSFNGTGNVSGTLSSVADISMSGNIKFSTGGYHAIQDSEGKQVISVNNSNVYVGAPSMSNVQIECGSSIFSVNNGGATINSTFLAHHNITTYGVVRSTLQRSYPVSWKSFFDPDKAIFASNVNCLVSQNSMRNILTWRDIVDGQGFITSYTIGSYRDEYKFGRMILAVGNKDDSSTYGAAVTIDGNNGMVTVENNLVATGEITAYSDRRLKDNIQPLANRGYIEPVTYDKKGKKSIGFIAQDVQRLYPELVTVGSDSNKYLSMNYAQYVAVLQAQIIELNNRVKQLESK